MKTVEELAREIEAAKQEVYRICRGANERWRMTIPVDEDHDSDRIICRGLEAGSLAAAAILAERERVDEKRRETILNLRDEQRKEWVRAENAEAERDRLATRLAEVEGVTRELIEVVHGLAHGRTTPFTECATERCTEIRALLAPGEQA